MRALPTSTRKRIRTSPRIDSARRLRSAPRSLDSIRAALASAATTRSADGWSRSSPRRRERRPVACLRVGERIVPPQLQIGGGASPAVVMSACSSPAAPAMLSRIISVHDAMAWVRAIEVARSSLAARRPSTGDHGREGRRRGYGPTGDGQDRRSGHHRCRYDGDDSFRARHCLVGSECLEARGGPGCLGRSVELRARHQRTRRRM